MDRIAHAKKFKTKLEAVDRDECDYDLVYDVLSASLADEAVDDAKNHKVTAKRMNSSGRTQFSTARIQSFNTRLFCLFAQ